MQTHFTEAQLADPKLAEANKILRSCVHCGFCTAGAERKRVISPLQDRRAKSVQSWHPVVQDLR